MTRRSMPCLFHANLFALGGARWLCQNIDGYAVQEAAVLLLEFLQLKRLVSLGWGNGPFLSLGLWIGKDNNRWQLF